MIFQEGPKHIGVKYTLKHFMFLINSAFVGEIILYLSKCTVKQQLKIFHVVEKRKNKNTARVMLYTP
jgi:hypothetical protein